MNIASIDIGSNTVLLLIANYNRSDQSLSTIINRYYTPRMGEGLVNGGKIGVGKVDQLIEILKEYKNVAAEYKCSKILITATNAFRIASNSAAIVQQVREKLSLDIQIIRGDEEAKLTFLGSAFPFAGNETKTIIDIGGGSTELIYGDRNNIFYKKSFDIGVVSLSENYFSTLPPSTVNLDAAYLYLNNIFTELSGAIPGGNITLAVGGTPTTLSCIKQGMKTYDDKLVNNSALSVTELGLILDELVIMNRNEVLNKYGSVVDGREDLLLAGTIILKIIIKYLGIEKITVSSKGLRYGTAINYLLGNQFIAEAK